MIDFIVGIILLTIPFLLLTLFRDKRVGFFYILFLSVIFQTIVGIITQYFGIFYYEIIFTISLIAYSILILLYWRRVWPRIKEISFKKLDWIALVVMFISIATLYQVHYNYTGKANLVTDQANSYHQVSNMKYVYPYFSVFQYGFNIFNKIYMS